MRRAGWAALLGPPVAVVLGVVLAATSPADDTTTARILFSVLEMAVPLAAAVGCASLVGRDPASEVQLTVPTPYRATLLRRLVVTLGWTAVVAVLTAVVLIATGWWHRWPANLCDLAGQLTWLSPALGLGAAGFAAAALFRSPAAAGAVVTSLWTFQQLFAGLTQQHFEGRVLYLLATTRGAVPGDWTANRLTLLAVAGGLVALAFVVLARKERLIGEGDQ